MPYSNVPRHQWGKMDRCVRDVMARDGVSKKRAIAICHASIVKEEGEVASSKDKRRQRRADARRQSVSNKGTNSDPEVLAMLGGREYDPGQKDSELDVLEDDDEQEETEEQAVSARAGPKGADKDNVVMMGPAYVVEEMPYGGSITWDDLDGFMLAREKAWQIEDLTYTFRTLVDNVMKSESVDPEEKADAVASLAVGFRNRVTAKKSLVDRVAEFKAQLTGSKRNDLPDSAFAYIEPGGKKDDSGRTSPRSMRHYPIHDEAHVRNALSRASAGVKAGGTEAEVARRALPKIRAAARKHGIGKPAAGKKDAPIGFTLKQGSDGTWRWFGWVSNQWRDKDHYAAPELGGEILTSEAHAEYVGWVYEDKGQRMPELWLWHTPGTARKARADWMDFAEGFLVASGPLEEKEAGEILALETMAALGMSHGMEVSGRDPSKGLITKYRTFEVSVLPLNKAANPWTSFSTIVKEVAEMGFHPEKRAYLVAALGETEVTSLEAQTEDMSKALMEIGVDFKSTEPPVEPAEGDPAPAPTPTPAPAPAAKAEGDGPITPDVKAVAKALVEELGISGLAATLKAMGDRVKALEATDAEKIKKAMSGVGSSVEQILTRRPTASKENEANAAEEPKVVTGAAETEWVAQTFGAHLAAPPQ